MKIQKVIVSANSNPLYFDFWGIFSYVWKEKMGIDPVLVYIDANPTEAKIDERWGEVIRIKSVEGIPEYLQTQWARFFFAGLYPNDVCMVSDIDMFPLSKEYFIDSIANLNLNESSHLHMNGNGTTGKFDDWTKGITNLSVCYHVNYGRRFSEIFNMKKTWEQEIANLHSLNLGKDQSQWAEHLKGLVNWGAEEDHTTAILREKVGSKTLNYMTCGLYGHRFDRSFWNRCKDVMNTYSFIDCHSLRPFSENKNEIMAVLSNYFGKMEI